MPQWFLRFSEFPEFTEFSESSAPFRENSIDDVFFETTSLEQLNNIHLSLKGKFYIFEDLALLRM